jgi:hypothetical protein
LRIHQLLVGRCDSFKSIPVPLKIGIKLVSP